VGEELELGRGFGNGKAVGIVNAAGSALPAPNELHDVPEIARRTRRRPVSARSFVRRKVAADLGGPERKPRSARHCGIDSSAYARRRDA